MISHEKNILHIINSMEPGGAENLLKFQLSHFDHKRYEIHLGYLIGNGSLIQQDWLKKVMV